MVTKKGPVELPPVLEVPIPAEPPAILVLEDQGEIQSLVAAMLRIRGFECDLAASLAEARMLMGRRHYDILFLDMNLPDGFGLSLMEEERTDAPLTIVMTGRSDIQTAIRAIRDGAIDFITKPFSVGHFLQRFDKAMEEWKTRRNVQYYSRALENLVKLTTEELTRTSRQMDEVRDMTVLALGAALNLKDHETADHCSRVSRNSAALGSAMGLSEFELKNLKWSAYLHDVGKIGIPEHILLKAGDLEPEERRTVEKHPLMGYTMLRNIEFLASATDVVLAHHERFDGSGYPRGLSGSRIPLHARIFAVVDTLDAMMSDRPYRGALSLSTVQTELPRCAGTQFDPEIVRIFLTAPAATWLVQGSAETQT